MFLARLQLLVLLCSCVLARLQLLVLLCSCPLARLQLFRACVFVCPGSAAGAGALVPGDASEFASSVLVYPGSAVDLDVQSVLAGMMGAAMKIFKSLRFSKAESRRLVTSLSETTYLKKMPHELCT